MRTCVRMKPELRAQARLLRSEGSSLRQIAARLGVALSTASLWTRDVPRPAPAPTSSVEPAGLEPLRRCSRCGHGLPLSAFNRGQWWCRGCFRRYYDEGAMHHRRRANDLKRRRVAAARSYVLDILARTSCADCGESDPVVLEFDHVGDKQAHVSTLVARGARLARIAAEIERCEGVCACCPRRRTARRAGWRRAAADLNGVTWRSPRHERNVRHVLAVLADAQCIDCAEADIRVLDFDHRGEKTGTVIRLARNEVSLERLTAEIERCEIRCANCHRRRTAMEASCFRTREIPPARIELALQP